MAQIRAPWGCHGILEFMKFSWMRVSGALLAGSYFIHAAFTPNEWHFIDYANLIFHEAGHTLFFFCGQFIQIAMGSGFQLLLPLSIACYFLFTDQRYSAAVCLMWVGQSAINVSGYAADALAMQLPLLGGDSSIHDWNYLLSTLHVLRAAPNIGAAFATVGFLLIVMGVALALYFSRVPSPIDAHV